MPMFTHGRRCLFNAEHRPLIHYKTMLVYFTFAIIIQLSKWNSAFAFIGLAPPPHQRRKGTTSLLQSQRSTVQQQQQQYAGILPILNELECGDSIIGYRDNGQHNVTVERCSCSPPIFVLRNFCSAQECDAILQSTPPSAMEPAQTSFGIKDEITRKKSYVAWLGNDAANATVGRLANEGRQFMLMPCRSLGVEDLQVVRYESGGEYTLHHDGNDRILTVLYYLNGEGETWFPLAKRTRNDDCNNRPSTRQEALAAAEGLQPGIDGVLVSTVSTTQTSECVPVRRGDAVAFYSYFQDGTPDWSAIHSGLPCRTEKIIANHFFRHVPNTTNKS